MAVVGTARNPGNPRTGTSFQANGGRSSLVLKLRPVMRVIAVGPPPAIVRRAKDSALRAPYSTMQPTFFYLAGAGVAVDCQPATTDSLRGES